jgi:hypothetical protein
MNKYYTDGVLKNMYLEALKSTYANIGHISEIKVVNIGEGNPNSKDSVGQLLNSVIT